MHDRRKIICLAAACALLLGGRSTCEPEAGFTNWENAPVHGLDMTPDGALLLAVNTPDNRVEVFALSDEGLPTPVASYPVGLDPVTVRARTNREAWVVNHISDSVSVLDLESGNVVATLFPGDEPTDVVFAGSPERAFVAVSRENLLRVYDPSDLDEAPVTVPIAGEDPRALATDGTRVYAAIFESGNRTTFLPIDVVSDPSGPYGGANPPPNSGLDFDPPMTPGLDDAPEAILVVRKDAANRWRDVNGADWTDFVPWDVHDHDVAVVAAAPPHGVSYVTGLMNLNMSVGVASDGRVAVVGTEALNEVRFEPNLRGTFLRVELATFPAGGGAASVVDLNPHLDYTASTVPMPQRVRSVADPRSVLWSTSGDRIYVSGMGSSNVVVTSPAGERLGRVPVGEGAATMALDETRGRLYVLDRFSASVSVVDTDALEHLGAVGFHDPTPDEIRDGRPLLYDAHATSGLGHLSCASCHVDARMDALAWDLGDPSGEMKPFNVECKPDVTCLDWHPVKGPLTTQTLVGIVGTEPFHWRGDREDLSAFAPAYVGLQGADAQPDAAAMQRLEDFIARTTFPPNPYRNVDGSLSTEPIFNGGVPAAGRDTFENDSSVIFDLFTCSSCHAGPLGTSNLSLPRTAPPAPTFNIGSLRSAIDKDGLSLGSQENSRGFGFTADGVIGSIFLGLDGFFGFPQNEEGARKRRDLEAYVFSFSSDTHAGVGQQVTLDATNRHRSSVLSRLDELMAAVDAAPKQIALMARTHDGERLRGAYRLPDGRFQMDRAVETRTLAELLAAAAAGQELTFTIVPYDSRVRMAVDRDLDGRFDGDEEDAGRDPADPLA